MKQKLTTLDLARLNKRRSAIEQETMCQWDFAHNANDNPAAEPGLFAEPAEACPETTVTACLPEAVQQTLPL